MMDVGVDVETEERVVVEIPLGNFQTSRKRTLHPRLPAAGKGNSNDQGNPVSHVCEPQRKTSKRWIT